ncbi:AAA family ATPase [Adlercreutzia mucosicola]|uniref:AAA family ATPase n=1 Tax=Adlercreutzia mucosicola TaxID=580026 RepID=UPI000414E291|nr:ATP-binding protein [Adlercreutzia mucosicola]MCR2034224.1 ATP-binding protein [Adlercreutzia mucosicola]
MALKSITVGGMRNLGLTHIELDGITAIVSANNYGKTNLMEALGFAAAFITASAKDRLAMMSYTRYIPLVTALQDEEFHFEVELDEPDLGEYRYIKYGFSFLWMRDDGAGRRITQEAIALKADKTGKWTNYLKRAQGKYRKSYQTRSFSTVVLDDAQLAIDVLTSFEDIAINPAIRKIRDMAFVMFDAIDAQGKFSSMPLEFPGEASADGGIALNDDDLPRALYGLRTLEQEKYDDFLSAIFTLFPTFESFIVDSYKLQDEIHERLLKSFELQEGEDDVPFRIKDELYRITVKDVHLNQPINIQRMSAGTKRIVWLVANTILANLARAEMVGIEELETSIHPQLIKSLLEILDENKGDTQLIISSHSPVLIQYLKPTQIYVGVPNENGVATFKRIRSNLIEKLAARAYDTGLGFGEYLFELMSSGERGSRDLLSYLEA